MPPATDPGRSLMARLSMMTWALRRQRATRATLRRILGRDEPTPSGDGRRDGQPGPHREAVDRLATGVAHDYNNLLMSISGNLELLEGDLGIAPPQRQRLAKIRQATDRGADLTRQLLATSRSQVLQPQSVDMNALIRQMLAPGPGDRAPLGLGPAIRLQTDLAGDLWNVRVDPEQVKVILLNLTANARDALPGGGTVTLRTENGRAGAHPPPGDHVVLTVADDGVGMTADVAARAVDPWFTTKSPGSGAGLGLSIVDGIAHQSGGGVRIESAPNVGTTVRVTLPRALPAAANGADAAPPGGDGADRRARFDTRQAAVLVIDDDAAVLDAVVATLGSAGVHAVAATDGRSGLARLEKSQSTAGGGIDLVLVDYAMPEMNGAAVAREVRRRWPGLPVTFMTGYAQVDALAGERFILQKPFRTSDLLRMLGEAAALS